MSTPWKKNYRFKHPATLWGISPKILRRIFSDVGVIRVDTEITPWLAGRPFPPTPDSKAISRAASCFHIPSVVS